MPSAQTTLVVLLLLLALVSEASALFEKKTIHETFTINNGFFTERTYPSHRHDLCNISRRCAPRQLSYAPRQHNPSKIRPTPAELRPAPAQSLAPLGSKAAVLPSAPPDRVLPTAPPDNHIFSPSLVSG